MSNLMERLSWDPNLTEQDVKSFLHEHTAKAVPELQHFMPVDLFWKDGDLEQYRAASAWWPKDAPVPMYACPPLVHLCMSIVQLRQFPLETFEQLLRKQADKAIEWLQQNDRDVANPNETREDRKRRKGREAVARHRKLNAAPLDERVVNVRNLHTAYIEACKARKAAAAAHDEAVAAAKLAWETARAALD